LFCLKEDLPWGLKMLTWETSLKYSSTQLYVPVINAKFTAFSKWFEEKDFNLIWPIEHISIVVEMKTIILRTSCRILYAIYYFKWFIEVQEEKSSIMKL